LKQECSGMVTWEDGIIHFFQGKGASRSLPLSDMTFSKCSNTRTLHVCKLCSNFSNEYHELVSVLGISTVTCKIIP